MPESPMVLVTGASGFIATHCILKLLERGYRVRGTLRTPERGKKLQAMLSGHGVAGNAVEFVKADLMSDAGWPEAAEGCTYVLHIASPIQTTIPKDENELIRPAREGTLRVLKASRDAGVKRVVLTSSCAAVVYGHEGNQNRTFTEADWTDAKSKATTPYLRSKTLAERAAWDWLKSEGGTLELTTILPGLVLGPALEQDFGSSLEAVRQVLVGAVPGVPDLAWPTVDVRDVAELHILAMTAPEAAGERFICANGLMTMREMAAIMRQRYPENRKIPRRNMPSWLMRFVALFNPAIASVMLDLDHKRNASHEKAVRVLGWKPRPNGEAVIAAADSLVEFGVV